MSSELSRQVDENFDFFQRTLSQYLDQHRGEYALIRDRQIVSFFATPGEADRAGRAAFRDGIYSIQEVAAEPVHLGLYSNAGH